MIMRAVKATAEEMASLDRVDQAGRSSMGAQVWIDGTAHFVSDIKIVRCVAVEGSLPHIITADQPRFSIDMRTKQGAVVTHQKDRDGGSLWRGAYYKLEDLEPVNLRRFDHWPVPDFEMAG
ncbi:MAG: hypothetical protein HRT64_12745 [Erythrobacter sp.]|nr:hypothetical protein [Erythrobacter sp.]